MPSLSIIDEFKLELANIAAEGSFLFEKYESTSVQHERTAILSELTQLVGRLKDIAHEVQIHAKLGYVEG